MSAPSLLVVGDDQTLAAGLKEALHGDFRVTLAEGRARTLSLLSVPAPDVVLLDLDVASDPAGGTKELRWLDTVLALVPRAKVIALSADADPELGGAALELGAFDALVKPVDLQTLKVVVRRAAGLKQLEEATDGRMARQAALTRFEDLLGATPAMQDIFAVIQRVARSDATVIIQGESGTGKELIARAIHNRSRRREAPFVPIDCGAIPETLLESELFGHEKGAFTGAHIRRNGKLELAEAGTLFLDEIGELSPALQVKLLRFLQERTIERVGGREAIKLDLRVIVATNKDLRALQQQGVFRPDLYYRLSVVTIQVPPLREREEDILLLANAFLRRAAREHRQQRQRLRLSSAAVSALLGHAWPGNVRELENRVSRAVIMTSGRFIEPRDLDLELPEDATERPQSLRDARGRVERATLVQALTRHRGNVSQAARDLAVSRPTLHGLLVKYGLDAKPFRPFRPLRASGPS
jgi:two-component system NtrC family response regulator